MEYNFVTVLFDLHQICNILFPRRLKKEVHLNYFLYVSPMNE